MMSIFSDIVEDTIEFFMDDFSVFSESFKDCLAHLSYVVKQCEDFNLVLNWEKCHFVVKEGIVQGHKISLKVIEVDRANIEVIEIHVLIYPNQDGLHQLPSLISIG